LRRPGTIGAQRRYMVRHAYVQASGQDPLHGKYSVNVD
jgi:hypothetical protein